MEDHFHKILNKYWGYKHFRDNQLEVIKTIVKGIDALAVMATGSGKSLCYQIPALIMPGKCIVVTPLIALMNDQIESLKKRSIKAIGIHSGQSSREQDILFDNMVYGDAKFLFISPERIETLIFQERAKKMNISLIAIDEAHCISEWGHDFRPAYRNIVELREILPGATFIALTATANKKVQEDIINSLKFKNYQLFNQSPLRVNLSYRTVYSENKKIDLLQLVKNSNQSTIIYVNRRFLTVELQNYLYERGIDASVFHAGISPKIREEIINKWNNNQISCIIATNAFGMGMDKPDVRLVMHYNIPQSLEAYVQEAGRAGRDGNPADAILIWNNNDIIQMDESIKKYFPPIPELQKLYKKLSVFIGIASGRVNDEWLDFDLDKFCKRNSYYASFVLNALKLLEEAELIILSEKFTHPSRLTLNEDKIKNYVNSKGVSDSMKSFIKSILRSYEGVFWDYRTIDEHSLASKNHQKVELVIKALELMNKLELGDYQASFIGYKLQFKSMRLRHSEISLPDKIYTARINRIKDKANSMISYLRSNECRQYLINSYFAFDESLICGICDNCETELELEEIERLIRNYAKDKSVLDKSLIGYNEHNKKSILDQIERMKAEELLEVKAGVIIIKE